ncbi:MAG TPA: DUF4404 family protein [Acidimicrobiales bacterium]
MEPSLQQLLDELDAAIDRVRDGDENRDELRSLMAAVQRQLDPDKDDEPGLGDALEGAATKFEAEHPTLTDALRRAVDALGAAGI